MLVAERRPPGFNVDLGFYDSEEVLSIPRKIRAAAVGVWTLCGCYAANKLSDGYVSNEMLKQLGCTPVIREALKATKPDPLWVDDAHVGGIWFTRWAKWQRTCSEVKAYREADAERKRRAREARRNASTSGDEETSGRTSGGPSQPVRPDSGTPKTETKTETETTTANAVERPRKRGTRLQADWYPPKDVIVEMETECPNVDFRTEHRKFIDYWISKPGKDGVKLDWNATWRNWIRRAGESTARGSLRVVNGGSSVDDKVNGWLDLANAQGRELE